MNAFWTYFWPAFAAGIVCGVIAGAVGFRLKIIRRQGEETTFVRPPARNRRSALLAGIAASIALAALWHGPFGAADRFSAEVERNARRTLDDFEMVQIKAHLHHGPLSRHLLLSGPADDFQTSELARITGAIPGVSRAQWTPEPAGPPLILEGAAVSLIGFLIGLLLAYLVELRRRHNAQWNW
ncbi:MAG: hypothetical protein V4502_02700 [Pseudomonadota bacterium]